jgi:hypothetical protein
MMDGVGGFNVGDEVVFVAFDQDPAFWPRINRPHIVVRLDLAACKVGIGMAGALITANTIMYVPPEDLMLWSFYRATMELADGIAVDPIRDRVTEEVAQAIANTNQELMYTLITGKRRK